MFSLFPDFVSRKGGKSRKDSSILGALSLIKNVWCKLRYAFVVYIQLLGILGGGFNNQSSSKLSNSRLLRVGDAVNRLCY